MKAIVRTLIKCMHINPMNGEVIDPKRPSVVTVCEFVSNLVMKGSIEAGSVQLPDNASDVEFEKFYIASDKNAPLAIKSYMEKLGANPDGSLNADAAADRAAALQTVAATLAAAEAAEIALLEAEVAADLKAAGEAAELKAKAEAAELKAKEEVAEAEAKAKAANKPAGK